MCQPHTIKVQHNSIPDNTKHNKITAMEEYTKKVPVPWWATH